MPEYCWRCRKLVTVGVVVHRECLTRSERDEAELRAENRRLEAELAAWKSEALELRGKSRP